MDTSITQIGLGAWGIGGADWGHGADRRQRIETVEAAVEKGVRFFDTAPTYGESEEILGAALRPHRERVMIATKFGPRDDPAASLERSLRRLNTDYVDLFQLHEPGENFEALLEKLAQLKDEERVREIGICNASPRQLERALQIAPLSSYQGAYNLFDREVEQHILPACRKNGLAFLAYRPLASGVLTDKFSARLAERLPIGDHRLQIWWFRGRELQRRLAVHGALKEAAAESGRTVSSLALAWLLERPGVTVVLAGARTSGQLEENLTAAEHPLSSDELELIETTVSLVYRPVRATRQAVEAAAEWGDRERFIVEHLDGRTPYDAIAAKWSERDEKGLLSAQVIQFVDQLAEAGMLT
ncbi:MAG: aldo/keto reductase [Actinomycetota bacterium]